MKNSFIKKGWLPVIMICCIALSSCYKKFDPDTYNPPFTINGFTSSDEIGAGHLVGYWSFDGNNIEAVSGTAGANTGTSFTGGFKGQAMQGALNSYILSAPSTAIASMQSFTVSEWVNTPPPSTGIIDFFTLANTTHFWGNIEMFFENGSSNANGKLRIHVFQNGNDNTFALDNVPNLFDKWINITVTYDAITSTCKIYINGSPAGSGPIGGVTGPLSFGDVGNLVFGTTQFNTTPSQTSGATAQSWASFLTGQIDEVRVYNTALEQKDIQALLILQGKGK